MATDLSWTQAPPPLSVPASPAGAGVPAPAAVPTPAPAAAPVPVAAVRRTAFAVYARLASGDLIQVVAHEDEVAARAEATALMRYLRDGRGDWPYLDGRFIRPDAIVSIDVAETPASARRL